MALRYRCLATQYPLVCAVIGLIIFNLVVFPGCTPSPSNPGTVEDNAILTERLRVHLERLTSEEMDGRMTGSTGYRRAADYAVELFASFGLEPGWTDLTNETSFFQPVPFVRYSRISETALNVQSKGEIQRFSVGEDQIILFSAGREKTDVERTPPIFVGFGIHEPALGWDDYAGLDVAGRTAVLLMNFPEENSFKMPDEVFRKYSDRLRGDSRRFNTVLERGARAALLVPDAENIGRWQGLSSYFQGLDFRPLEDYGPDGGGESAIPILILNRGPVEAVFTGFPFHPLSRKGRYMTGVLEECRVEVHIEALREKFECQNVLALLEGTGQDGRKEFITLGAHLDHLGRRGEFLLPGANDDASGVAIVLEAARALAAAPPKRSVLFVLFTAEEVGHYGSLHFVKYPPVSHEKIVMNVNLEQIGSKHRNVRGLWALGPVSQREAFASIKEKIKGIEARLDDIEDHFSVVQGSDTWSFVLAEKPAIIIGSGGFPEHHTPGDTIVLIDFDHLTKASRFVTEYVRRIANEAP